MNEVIDLLPKLFEATGETLLLVSFSLLFGGIGGLLVGLVLYLTRQGNLYEQRFVNAVMNVVVNFFRPIPFIIFITAIGPLTMQVVGKTIGTEAVIFPMTIMASFAFSRLVEQNLVSIDPGVVEAYLGSIDDVSSLRRVASQ